MELGKQHDTTDTTDFFPRQIVTDLLLICYRETGVMDFGLYSAAATTTRPTTTICAFALKVSN